jgi:hypothetical protein
MHPRPREFDRLLVHTAFFSVAPCEHPSSVWSGNAMIRAERAFILARGAERLEMRDTAERCHEKGLDALTSCVSFLVDRSFQGKRWL